MLAKNEAFAINSAIQNNFLTQLSFSSSAMISGGLKSAGIDILRSSPLTILKVFRVLYKLTSVSANPLTNSKANQEFRILDS